MPPAKNKNQQQQKQATTNTSQKFNEVHARNIDVAKKLVENYESSESEDELDEKTILGKNLMRETSSAGLNESIVCNLL